MMKVFSSPYCVTADTHHGDDLMPHVRRKRASDAELIKERVSTAFLRTECGEDVLLAGLCYF